MSSVTHALDVVDLGKAFKGGVLFPSEAAPASPSRSLRAYVVMVGIGHHWSACTVAAGGGRQARVHAMAAYSGGVALILVACMKAVSRRASWLDEVAKLQDRRCVMEVLS